MEFSRGRAAHWESDECLLMDEPRDQGRTVDVVVTPKSARNRRPPQSRALLHQSIIRESGREVTQSADRRVWSLGPSGVQFHEAAVIVLFGGGDGWPPRTVGGDIVPSCRTRLSRLGSILEEMKRFDDRDLTDSEFRECDLTRARLIGVVMQDAIIEGLVTNLVINGVEVSSYVESELDRRHPVRPLIRSADPIELLQGLRELRVAWSATLERLRMLPKGSEHCRVGDEWSAVETLRHLVFVHDCWFARCCLGSTGPVTAFGLVPEYVLEHEQGLDPTATPSLDEVLAVRDLQSAALDQWLSSVTADELSKRAPVPEGAGWPPYARGKSVLDCMHVVLDEEWAHHGFCLRDIALLER